MKKEIKNEKLTQSIKSIYKDAKPSNAFVEELSSKLLYASENIESNKHRNLESFFMLFYKTLFITLIVVAIPFGVLYSDQIGNFIRRGSDSNISNVDDFNTSSIGFHISPDASNKAIVQDFVQQTKIFETLPVDNIIPTALNAEDNLCLANCGDDDFIYKTFNKTVEAPGFKAVCTYSKESNKTYTIYYQNNMLTRIVETDNKSNVIVAESVANTVLSIYTRERLDVNKWSSWKDGDSKFPMIVEYHLDTLLYKLLDQKSQYQEIQDKLIINENGTVLGKELSFNTLVNNRQYSISIKTDSQLLINNLDINFDDGNTIFCELSNFNNYFGTIFPKFYPGTVDNVWSAVTTKSAIKNLLVEQTLNHLSYTANIVVNSDEEKYVATAMNYSPVEIPSIKQAKYIEEVKYDNGTAEKYAVVGAKKYLSRSEDNGVTWTDWSVYSATNFADRYSLKNIVSPSVIDKDAWDIEDSSLEDGPSDLIKILNLKLVEKNNQNHYVILKVGFNISYSITSIYVEEYLDGISDPNITKVTFFYNSPSVLDEEISDELRKSLDIPELYTYTVDVIADVPRSESDRFAGFKTCNDPRPGCQKIYIEKDKLNTDIYYGKEYRIYYNDSSIESWEEDNHVYNDQYIEGDFKLELLYDIASSQGFKNRLSVVAKPYFSDEKYITFNKCILKGSDLQKVCSIYKVSVQSLREKNKYVMLGEDYELFFRDVREIDDPIYGRIYEIIGDYDVIHSSLVSSNYKYIKSTWYDNQYEDPDLAFFETCDMLYRCVMYGVDKNILNAKGIVPNSEYRYYIYFDFVEPLDTKEDILQYRIVGDFDIKVSKL